MHKELAVAYGHFATLMHPPLLVMPIFQAFRVGVRQLPALFVSLRLTRFLAERTQNDYTIRSYLHFSVPDVGPLTDYESWMPDFMSGLAKGIEQSRKLVDKAVSGVAADMVINPKVNPPALATAGGSMTSGDKTSLVSAIREAMEGLTAPESGDIVIPVYLGGNLLDEVIVNAQQRANLRSGGH